jgi:hypothetical protein
MTPEIEKCIDDLRGAISGLLTQKDLYYALDKVDAVVKAVDEEINQLLAQVSKFEFQIQQGQKPRKKRDPGLMKITALKVLDAPEWATQVRAALDGRTIQAAADKLGVSYTTMKRFKADLGKVEKKIADGTWKK